VIVDAPATGHGLAIMRTPLTFANVARVGPVAQQGRTIHETITDTRHTGVIAVALPEEMPVNETLTLRDELRRELGLPLDRVIVNALYPERFGPRQAATLSRALEGAGTPVARAALRAALSEQRRARGQREQVARLEEALGDEAIRLPYVFEPEIGPEQFEALSRELEVAL
jgi:anion-transporting  ArsA/GET3 family ATPase